MQSNHKNGTATLDPRQWVERHADYLFNYAISRINDPEQAGDLVQDTFLAALEKKDTFRGDSAERTWLTAILRFKIIDIYRRQSSWNGQRTDAGEAEQEQHDFFDKDDGHWNEPYRPRPFEAAPSDLLINREFTSILQKCMHKLPALWFSVFSMKHMDEEETDTICKELCITPSNFWVIIHRAKLNLRACLQKNWI